LRGLVQRHLQADRDVEGRCLFALQKCAQGGAKADLEQLRKLEAERIADLRQRIWSDPAGKPDPKDRTKVVAEDFAGLCLGN
jgi:hypothetical protein